MTENNSDSDESKLIPTENISSDLNLENTVIRPQDDMERTCGCATKQKEIGNSPNYVYAIGKISFRFPNMSIEKELRQASGRKAEDLKGNALPEVLSKTLTDPNNRYIARQLCWIFEIENLPTYIIIPMYSDDIDRFIQALRVTPERNDIDVIIGRRGPVAGPERCNGLILPIVAVDQLYSFDRDALIEAIRKSKETNNKQFSKTADAVVEHVRQLADNVGSTDEHRAINYLTVRYDQIYNRTQLMQDRNFSLQGVEVQISRLSGTRKIVDVIFTYEERSSAATERWFTRVDVTEEFPFLVSPLQQFFER